MSPAPTLSPVDPALMGLVWSTAARVSRTYGIDRDDVHQELLLACLPRLQKFDATKSSSSTFIHRIVNNGAANLIKARTAACRDHRLCQNSLSDPIEFGARGSAEFRDNVSADDYEARVGRSALSARERTELRFDIGKVIATLPTELAAIAILLKSESVVDTGRRLGLSRATVYRRVSNIRQVFASAGLNQYLGRSQSLPERRVGIRIARVSGQAPG